MDLAQLLIDAKIKASEMTSERSATYGTPNNRCSEVGHPCSRYLYYVRVSPEMRTPFDPFMHFVFDRGNSIEDYAKRELTALGVKVTRAQQPFAWKEIKLTGAVDFFVEEDGVEIPVEVKALSPFYIDKLNSVEDMLNSDRIWVKKYPAQLTMYLLLSGMEMGKFLLFNALTWRPKQIEVPLDYDYADGIVKKLEGVNAAVEEGSPPAGIEDLEYCGECPFLHVCLPTIIKDDMVIDDDPEVIEMLSRRQELAPLASEYESIEKSLKKRLEGIEQMMIGKFLISGKWVTRKGYTVQDGQYWRKTIKEIPDIG